MILQPRCWVSYSTFVLLGLVKWFLKNPLLRALRLSSDRAVSCRLLSVCGSTVVRRSSRSLLLRALRLSSDRAVSCRLLSVCGSTVVRRSSRSLRSFGVFLSVAWSHPTFLLSIKLVIHCLQQVISFSGPPSCRFISVPIKIQIVALTSLTEL